MFIVLILLNLLIAIVTDVWQSFDREKIYLEAINDEIREAVSNHVEGIDYGKGSRLRDKVKTWSLNKMDSHDSFNLK